MWCFQCHIPTPQNIYEKPFLFLRRFGLPPQIWPHDLLPSLYFPWKMPMLFKTELFLSQIIFSGSIRIQSASLLLGHYIVFGTPPKWLKYSVHCPGTFLRCLEIKNCPFKAAKLLVEVLSDFHYKFHRFESTRAEILYVQTS